MLRLRDPQRKLWDTMVAQPELLKLPQWLQEVDEYLDDNKFLEPFIARATTKLGRPTVPIDRYLRLMFLKHSKGLGYETLVKEVADSLTLRNFARFDISEPIPNASTLSRLTKRFGEDSVREIHKGLVQKLERDGFIEGKKLRTDTTVMAADITHPTDAGLLSDGVRVISRTVDKLRKLSASLAEGFRDSKRTMNKALWEISRFLKKRVTAGQVEEQTQESGDTATDGIPKPTADEKRAEIRQKVNDLTAQAYEAARRTVSQARDVAKRARRKVARGSEKTRRRVAQLCDELTEWSNRTQKALEQTKLRLGGQLSIPNRMVSIFDPDARPIRRGKLSSPTEFGYKVEVTQVENLIISDYQVHVGNPADSTLLEGVVERHIEQFEHPPEEVATDRGYHCAANEKKLREMGVKYVSSPACGKLSKARAEHQSQRWFKRLQKWRAGCEGSISSFKRGFGGRRTRLRQRPGAEAWAGWGVIAHNLEKIPRLLAARALRRVRALAGIAKKAT